MPNSHDGSSGHRSAKTTSCVGTPFSTKESRRPKNRAESLSRSMRVRFAGRDLEPSHSSSPLTELLAEPTVRNLNDHCVTHPLMLLSVRRYADVGTSPSGSVAPDEDLFARPPHLPGGIPKGILVDMQHRDFRAGDLGRLRVHDDLPQAKTDHKADL
jgi:hypothetical protein